MSDRWTDIEDVTLLKRGDTIRHKTKPGTLTVCRVHWDFVLAVQTVAIEYTENWQKLETKPE